LKIAIGFEIKNDSWGGGNQFAKSLVKEASRRGHEITFKLKDSDIDIILFTDPRSYIRGINFGSFEILNYLFFKNRNAIVIHRINECDERKNTNYMNKFLKWSNYCADFTIFISNWLKQLDVYQKNKESRVILNGGDPEIFNYYKSESWDGNCPLKIITHHWSPNFMKGFDVYQEIDKLLNNSEWASKFKFTYIGNLPPGFCFKNTNHINPISGKRLGFELSKHHLYLTASLNEPAGMHHIEGIMCGLPIIYRESGAIPEYCESFGVSFKERNFLPALKEISKNYDFYKKRVSKYPNNSIKMTNQYLNLFEELLKKRDFIVKKRNLFQSPTLLLKNYLFIFLKLRNVVRFLSIKSLKKKFR
tara:strand:- start:2498 stop:3580 length:1083 start_codon:yes stop_codon:yes gene_type:complete